MDNAFHLHEIPGAGLGPWLDALGELRIRVFREFPYLYDGTAEYEKAYLEVYLKSPRSRIVLVTDDSEKLIGATTCLPLADEGPEFQQPFLQNGHDVERILYLGESMLLPEWRGRGLGKEFFVRREAHARDLGLPVTAFCAVDRTHDHPARPAGYRSLEPFWESRGYVKRPELRAEFSWKDIGETDESPKSLTFWVKSLDLSDGGPLAINRA